MLFRFYFEIPFFYFLHLFNSFIEGHRLEIARNLNQPCLNLDCKGFSQTETYIPFFLKHRMTILVHIILPPYKILYKTQTKQIKYSGKRWILFQSIGDIK